MQLIYVNMYTSKFCNYFENGTNNFNCDNLIYFYKYIIIENVKDIT